MNVSEVPCDETLSVIREILLIVFLGNVIRNLFVHFILLLSVSANDRGE